MYWIEILYCFSKKDYECYTVDRCRLLGIKKNLREANLRIKNFD